MRISTEFRVAVCAVQCALVLCALVLAGCAKKDVAGADVAPVEPQASSQVSAASAGTVAQGAQSDNVAKAEPVAKELSLKGVSEYDVWRKFRGIEPYLAELRERLEAGGEPDEFDAFYIKNVIQNQVLMNGRSLCLVDEDEDPHEERYAFYITNLKTREFRKIEELSLPECGQTKPIGMIRGKSESLFVRANDCVWCGFTGDNGPIVLGGVSDDGELAYLIKSKYGSDSETTSILDYDSKSGELLLTLSYFEGKTAYVVNTETRALERKGSKINIDPKEAMSTIMAIQNSAKADHWEYVSYDGETRLRLKKDLGVLSMGKSGWDEPLTDYAARVATEQGMTYLTLADGRKLLVLRSDGGVCLLLNADGSVFFAGASNYAKFIGRQCVFSASSELTDGGTTYAARNLNSLDGATPWVEGVDGNGIGQYVDVHSPYDAYSEYGDAKAIVFYNGYISPARPDLYGANGRVKGLGLYDTDGTLVQRITLLDTPAPQVVLLERTVHDCRLTIEAVYPGSKWEDTCLHAIQLIPGDVVYAYEEHAALAKR